MAKQASGAVVVRQGDTMVLATAVAGAPRDVDFLPLTVDVEERMYATGKIPGSFFKREGRPGEKATLTARMIDRPLRPLFPKGWRNDTQLVAIPMSVDHLHPYDILAMNGASAAVMISDIPFPTPVGAVRIGKVDGDFVINPREQDLLAPDGDEAEPRSDLDLVVAGTDGGRPPARLRRRRHERGLGRGDDLRHSLPHTCGGGAHRQGGRRLRDQPPRAGPARARRR